MKEKIYIFYIHGTNIMESWTDSKDVAYRYRAIYPNLEFEKKKISAPMLDMAGTHKNDYKLMDMGGNYITNNYELNTLYTEVLGSLLDILDIPFAPSEEDYVYPYRVECMKFLRIDKDFSNIILSKIVNGHKESLDVDIKKMVEVIYRHKRSNSTY